MRTSAPLAAVLALAASMAAAGERATIPALPGVVVNPEPAAVADFTLTSRTMSAGDEFELPPAGVDLEKLERSLVIQALKRSGGNQTRAGTYLGLNRDQIRYRVEKFGLTITAPR